MLIVLCQNLLSIAALFSLQSSQTLWLHCPNLQPLSSSRTYRKNWGTLDWARHLPLKMSPSSLSWVPFLPTNLRGFLTHCLTLTLGNPSFWTPTPRVFGLLNDYFILAVDRSVSSLRLCTPHQSFGPMDDSLILTFCFVCPFGFIPLLCWGLWSLCVPTGLWSHCLASAPPVLLSFIVCVSYYHWDA